MNIFFRKKKETEPNLCDDKIMDATLKSLEWIEKDYKELIDKI